MGRRLVNLLPVAQRTNAFTNSVSQLLSHYITLIKGRDYIKHDINVRRGKPNPRRGRYYYMILRTSEYDLTGVTGEL